MSLSILKKVQILERQIPCQTERKKVKLNLGVTVLEKDDLFTPFVHRKDTHIYVYIIHTHVS